MLWWPIDQPLWDAELIEGEQFWLQCANGTRLIVPLSLLADLVPMLHRSGPPGDGGGPDVAGSAGKMASSCRTFSPADTQRPFHQGVNNMERRDQRPQGQSG